MGMKSESNEEGLEGNCNLSDEFPDPTGHMSMGTLTQAPARTPRLER